MRGRGSYMQRQPASLIPRYSVQSYRQPPACNPCDWPELAGGRFPQKQRHIVANPRNAETVNLVVKCSFFSDKLIGRKKVSGDEGEEWCPEREIFTSRDFCRGAHFCLGLFGTIRCIEDDGKRSCNGSRPWFLFFCFLYNIFQGC